MESTGIPWYYGPIIFLGALMIVLSVLVFLHWLVQFWLDNQEKENPDDIIESDNSEFESPYEKHLMIKKNKVKKKRKFMRANHEEIKRGSIPKIDIIKAASETSSVSDKSVKIRSKKRLAVSLCMKHSTVNMRLSGMIKGVIGLQFPNHGGPDKIRFKLELQPSSTKKFFKTPFHIPLDSSLIIPFQFLLIPKTELQTSVIHLRLFGKKEKFGLPIGPEHCFGEAFVSLKDLASGVDEINVVQEIIPLGSKPFHRESLNIRVSAPKIRTKQFANQQIEVAPEEINIFFNDGDNDSAKDEKRDRSTSYLVDKS
ncbi:uncharacterized protein LOC135692150 isoform X1 [Rhopilema esculentum]|uniref:uncharacterized protein LOC135692150 isoform X1 n=1 Tax=Rhopilema esculentum TaxID=499914 RepID=UPI0031D4CC9C